MHNVRNILDSIKRLIGRARKYLFDKILLLDELAKFNELIHRIAPKYPNLNILYRETGTIMKQYLLVQVAQYALIFDNKKRFLILQFGKSKNPEHSKRWVLPGGRVEEGERNLIKALKREVKEETGLKNVKILFPFFNEISKHSGELALKICYICKYSSGKVKIKPNHPDNIINYKWINYEDVNRFSFIGRYGDKMFKRFIKESKKFIYYI